MSFALQDLLSEIEQCRREMVLLAMETSFTNLGVVEKSERLDQLLNEYEMKQKV